MTFIRLVLESGRVVFDGPFRSRFLAELRLYLDCHGRMVDGQRVVSARIVRGDA